MGREIRHRWGGTIEFMRNCETQSCEVVRSGAIGLRGDVVEASRVHRSNEKRSLLVTQRLADGMILPKRDVQFSRDFERLLAHRLPQPERHDGSRVRDVLTQNKNRVGELHFMQRGRARRPFAQNIEHLEDNVAAAGLELTDDDMSLLAHDLR